MSGFTEKLKEYDLKFSNAIVEKASYSRGSKTLEADIITSKHFTEEDCAAVSELIKKALPFCKPCVRIKKSVCDEVIAKNAALEYVKGEYPVLTGRFNAGDLSAEKKGDEITFTVCAEQEVCDYLKNKNFFDGLKNFLAKRYCESFVFAYAPRDDSDDGYDIEPQKVDYSRLEEIPLRKLKVTSVTRLFDNNDTDEALYIADALDHTGETAIAGKVVSVRQRETKTGKPFYIVDISDGTGRMSGTIFSTKDIIRKMEKIQEGSEVIAVGNCEIANGYHRFTIKSLNFCDFPKNFVPEERASRKPPEIYLNVSPSEIEEIRQTDMFSDQSVPECLKGTSFVVVDLETTGTSPADDRVTEIGAVKKENGKIVCKFATMVNPERKIPAEVVELTGITDDMVADAPKFADVAGDLYKFCYGSVIVAHNLPFDYNFIKNLSKPLNYVYTNRGADTLDLSRALVKGLPNYKLDMVCGHFGIEFLHHRAYSDALATAQLFIELIRIRGNIDDLV